MKKALLIVSILFVVSNVLHSQFYSFYSGNELLAMLERPLTEGSKGFADQAVAYGYILGVYDVYNGVHFRSPGNITAGQLTDIGKKYLKDNPERRHEPAYILLHEAFKEAFPIKDLKEEKEKT